MTESQLTDADIKALRSEARMLEALRMALNPRENNRLVAFLNSNFVVTVVGSLAISLIVSNYQAEQAKAEAEATRRAELQKVKRELTFNTADQLYRTGTLLFNWKAMEDRLGKQKAELRDAKAGQLTIQQFEARMALTARSQDNYNYFMREYCNSASVLGFVSQAKGLFTSNGVACAGDKVIKAFADLEASDSSSAGAAGDEAQKAIGTLVEAMTDEIVADAGIVSPTEQAQMRTASERDARP